MVPSLSNFKKKLTDIIYAQDGWYRLADSGFQYPDWLFEAAKEKGSIYTVSLSTVVYEYLTNKVTNVCKW